MTERETKYHEKLILGKIRNLLSHVGGHTREILDLEAGRDYLCSLCDMPLKPCTVHQGYLCCTAIKGGTELLELEQALVRLERGEYGICILCGEKISKQHLITHPTAVYCSSCRTDAQRQRRRKSKSSGREKN